MDEIRYQEALDYLYSFVDYSRTRSDRYSPESFDLDRVRRLLSELGDPQAKYPTLHIAGTKGKGSVAALCASALQAAGFRTGLYTSPHLVDFTERIQVDGEQIPRAAVVELVELLMPLAADIPEISTYELITALGFEHFARREVDVAVVEVGLGGRLDATNVLKPQVTAITSISLDHTQFLGESLAKIAGEKAGIIKPGVPVVSAPQRPPADRVIESIAERRTAPLLRVGRDWRFEALSHNLKGQRLRVQSGLDGGEVGHELNIPLLGEHQVENAAVASAVLHLLSERGLEVPLEAVRRGFEQVEWPGRFQILSTEPTLVVDCAHNQDSAFRLRQTLEAHFPDRRVQLVFGASEDKDIDGMLRALAPSVQRVYLTKAFHPRAAQPAALEEKAAEHGLDSRRVPNVMTAVSTAVSEAGPTDVVLVTGSLFVVGEVLSRWREEDRPFPAPGTEEKQA